MTPGKERLLYGLGIGVVLALALLLRTGAIYNTTQEFTLRGDALDYYYYALNLKFHHVFARTPFSPQDQPEPDAVRTPVYPLLLTAVLDYPTSKEMIRQVSLIQALLDCITVLLVLAVTRRVAGPAWALGAALLTACSPHLISMTTYVLTETLFTCLTLLSAWLLLRAHEGNHRILAVLAGMVIAATALTRPTLQYFIVPLFALLLLHGHRGTGRSLALPVLLGFVLLFAPWQARNVLQTGALSDPTLTTTTLHHGMYPDLRYEDRPETIGYPYRYNPRNEELSSDRAALISEITQRFRSEPGRYITWYLFGKPVTLLSWNILAGMGDIFVYPVTASPFLGHPAYMGLAAIMKQLHWPLTVLALCATLLAWLPAVARRLPEHGRLALRLLSLLVLYFIALHIIAAPFPRYGIPLRPLVYALAMALCAQLAAYVSAARSRRSGMTA